jgi:hypothetical protein
MVMIGFLLLVAGVLSRFTVYFEHFGSTMWLLTTVFIYTFGAEIISDLFMVFPCFEAADGSWMIHDPSTTCYGHSTLMILAPIAICTYTAAAVYVLGFTFWSRKDVIQHPASHDKSELEHTFKAFGFLFYGAHAQCLKISFSANRTSSSKHITISLNTALACLVHNTSLTVSNHCLGIGPLPVTSRTEILSKVDTDTLTLTCRDCSRHVLQIMNQHISIGRC